MQGHQALDNSSKSKFAGELKYGETISGMQAHRRKTETESGIRREGKRKEKRKREAKYEEKQQLEIYKTNYCISAVYCLFLIPHC